MKLNIKQVQKKYNRFPLLREIVEWPLEKLYYRKWRKDLLHEVTGKVLEIGVGTGKNLPYYNYGKVNLIAIDISEGMLARAQERVKKNGFPVKLQLIGSENLPFKDNTFDYVVCTLLLCSVPDQMKMLKEMQRIVKKEGKIVMFEHVLSKNKFIAFIENLHNPLIWFLMGININRDTMGNIKKCGLKITKEQNLAFFDVFKMIEAKK